MKGDTVPNRGIAAEVGAGPSIPDISVVSLGELRLDEDARKIVDVLLTTVGSPDRLGVTAFNSAI